MQPTKATFLKSVSDPSQLPVDARPHVAMLGRSNVGKSSLINSLTGAKGLSRTSATPGRTQLINLFKINDAFYLVDLPGYGYAKASKEKRDAFQHLIFSYLDHAERLRLAVVIVDAVVGPTPLDIQILIHLEEKHIPFIVVANKIDKLSQSKRATLIRDLKEKLPGVRILLHSTRTSEGRGEIFAAIQEACRT